MSTAGGLTETIKPELALPWSTDCALTLSCSTEPIGCNSITADAAASRLFYSLSVSSLIFFTANFITSELCEHYFMFPGIMESYFRMIAKTRVSNL